MLTRGSKRKQQDDFEIDSHNSSQCGKDGAQVSNKRLALRQQQQQFVLEDKDTRRRWIQHIQRQWPDSIAPRCTSIHARYIKAVRSDESGCTENSVDEKGHAIFFYGDMLTSRYRITKFIGKGTFAKVFECYDEKERRPVAAKVVRNVEKYRKAAMNEIMVIMTMMRHDPQHLFDFARLEHWFDYPRGGHATLVFPKLGPSVFATMERNEKPFPVSIIQKYLKCLFETVAFMHSIGIIHTDIKPENVLHDDVEYEVIMPVQPGLASEFPKSHRVSLIDFGSALFIEGSHPKLVSTRHYRAPEVLLGLPWSQSIDVWSAGCLLLEFVTGETFFYGHDPLATPEEKDLEQLGMIERVFGDMPVALVDQCQDHLGRDKYKQIFRQNGTVRYPNSATCKRFVREYWKIKRLEEYFCADTNPSLGKGSTETDNLLDLARRMLQWLPEDRCSFAEALNHPFFSHRFN